MKKIILTSFFLALVLAGCSIKDSIGSFIFPKRNAAPQINQTVNYVATTTEKNSDTTSLVGSSTAVQKSDGMEKLISALNGETIYSLQKKNLGKSAVSRMVKELENTNKTYASSTEASTTDCYALHSDLLSDLGLDSDYAQITEYYWPATELSFLKNLKISLVMKDRIECQIKYLSLFSTSSSPTKEFFYGAFAPFLIYDFYRDAILLKVLSVHPEYCQNVAETFRMGQLCRKLTEEDVVNRLRRYYQITGVLDYFKDYQNLYLPPEQAIKGSLLTDEYIKKRLTYVGEQVYTPTILEETKTIDQQLAQNGFADMGDLEFWPPKSETLGDMYNFDGSSDKTMEDKTNEILYVDTGDILFMITLANNRKEDAKNIDYISGLIGWAHPDKGIRFSFSSTVDTNNDLVLKKSELEPAFKGEQKYVWNKDKKTGLAEELTFGQYLEKYIYPYSETNAEHFSNRDEKYQDLGNTNIKDVYGPYVRTVRVDYNKDFDKNQINRTTWFVYEMKDGNWYLIGIVSGS